MIKPHLLDNGALVQTKEELADALHSMDMQIFRGHVNDKKNDIAKWVRDEVKDTQLAEKLQPITSKKEMVAALREKKPEQKEGENEDGEGGQKKEEGGENKPQ